MGRVFAMGTLVPASRDFPILTNVGHLNQASRGAALKFGVAVVASLLHQFTRTRPFTEFHSNGGYYSLPAFVTGTQHTFASVASTLVVASLRC